MKKILSLIISCSLIFSLSSCSLFKEKPNTDIDERPTLEDIKEKGDYILGSKNGEMILLDSANQALDKTELKNNKKSDFIYTVDNGTVYAAEVVDTAAEGQIVYALDRGNNKVYMLSVKGDKIKEIASKSIKDSNVTSIYAYNGTFYYSVFSEKRSSNKYTYQKIESEKQNGIINYNAALPEPLPSKTKTYVITINFIDEYLKEMGYDKLSSYSKSNMDLGPDAKSQTYQIPCEVNSWIADGTNIYFFYNERMGQYNMDKNQIGLYYGPQYTYDSALLDGLNGSVFTFSDFGDSSNKGMIFELNQGNMNVKNIIETENPNGLNLAVDRMGYICTLVKNDGDKYFSTLDIYNSETLKKTGSIPLTYVPTQLEAHNEKAYLMNENEGYYLIVDLISQTTEELNKVVNNTNYTSIIPVNSLKVDSYLYNEDGHYVDENGIEMLADGTLINDKKVKINKYMQKIDENGRAINDNGDFIDRYNNIIDENKNIIEYVLGDDGYYRNSKGIYVNKNGIPLIEDEEGNLVDPDIEVDEPITGHYDENGKFIIDADYLERHPDAYDKLEKGE